jgi:hypothetical protein
MSACCTFTELATARALAGRFLEAAGAPGGGAAGGAPSAEGDTGAAIWAARSILALDLDRPLARRRRAAEAAAPAGPVVPSAPAVTGIQAAEILGMPHARVLQRAAALGVGSKGADHRLRLSETDLAAIRG